MTNMYRSGLISGPNPSQIPYNNVTYLCLPPLRNANHARQVMKLPIVIDCRPSPRLYIACKAREGNLEHFFKHENSSSPPVLSCHGKMCTGQKSELITCVERDFIL